MRKFVVQLGWSCLAALGAWAFLTLVLRRGEAINSGCLLLAALCSYAIGYRFYAKWIGARVLMLDDRRATPCEIHDDGRDFVKTNRWIVFGHHFAAISGPGPLVGPVLAAQFGYLPGGLWILIGVVLGGAVQDFVILVCSLRRDGKSLGQMVKEEMNNAVGFIALLAVLSIVVILLAVLALVVVNALAESPWGIFTVGATIPIALFMGVYLRSWRVGRILEASALGVGLLWLAVWGGQLVYSHPALAQKLSLRNEPIAWAIILYGLAASVLPIWLLLAPRDYLSTFMKLGTIALLALGTFALLPKLRMPALTSFCASGAGPVFAGKLFPFCFITIACGAISGFHSLIASGTTPKILTRESYARSIGYGAMCLESLVAIMALIAACTLEPGVYFSINMKGAPAETIATVSALGYPASLQQMNHLAQTIGEKTLFGRVGGAPTLAVGMANVFSSLFSGAGLGLWYHFAIMFEALFILTTLDAGTRVGRYLLQDLLGQIWKPLGETGRTGSNWLASLLIVSAWGYFLIQGVRDPLGGINSLWPLFGIANQLLATIALCLATTVIFKMQLAPPVPEAGGHRPQAFGQAAGRPLFAWITLAPLLWLLAVTLTAGVEKIFDSDPKIGFLKAARDIGEKLPALRAACQAARQAGDPGAIASAEKLLQTNQAMRLNAQLDTAVTGVFMIMVILIFVLSAREWVLLLARRKIAQLKESPPVWLPAYAVVEARPLRIFSLLALGLTLAKELSGQAAMDRVAQTQAGGDHARSAGVSARQPRDGKQQRQQVYLQAAQKRFKGVNRCC
jgi:carbon starvation protein